MKKYLKKIIYLAIITNLSIMVFTIVLCNQNNQIFNDTDVNQMSSLNMSYIDLNSPYMLSLVEQELESQFGSDYKKIIETNKEMTEISSKVDAIYSGNDENEIKYSENFGGKYIDDNNNLIVQILENTDIKEIEKIKSLSEDIILKYVDNSYNELDAVNTEITNYFELNGVKNTPLLANYIDIINNNVVVELENNTLEEQTWFKKNVSNSPLINFIKGQNYHSTSVYNAGSGINNGNCSVGYRAKLNGVAGFVTAGHCFKSEDKNLTLGTVSKRRVSGQLDAEFITVSSGNSVTNTLQYPHYFATKINTRTSSSYTSSNISVGTAIAKNGSRTGLTTGKILNLNFSMKVDDGIYLTNQVKTDVQSNFGDSGGVVFLPGTSLDKTGTVLGIVVAKENKNGIETDNPGNLVYTKASIIDSTFGLTRY